MKSRMHVAVRLNLSIAAAMGLFLASDGAYGLRQKTSLTEAEQKHYTEQFVSFAVLREWDCSLFLGGEATSKDSLVGSWRKTIQVLSNGTHNEVLRFDRRGWQPYVRVFSDERQRIRHLVDRTVGGEVRRTDLEYNDENQLETIILSSESGFWERRELHRNGEQISKIESYNQQGQLNHTDLYHHLGRTILVVRMASGAQIIRVRWFKLGGEVVFVKENQYAVGPVRFDAEGGSDAKAEALTTERILLGNYDDYEANLERAVHYRASGLFVYERLGSESTRLLLHEGSVLVARIKPLRFEALDEARALNSLLSGTSAWEDFAVTTFERLNPSIQKHSIMTGKRIKSSTLFLNDVELLTSNYSYYANGSMRGIAVSAGGRLLREDLFPMNVDGPFRAKKPQN